MSLLDLPLEIGCQIIEQITDLKSLINYTQTSRLSAQLARFCVKEIKSDDWTAVPLNLFEGFHNLKVIGGNLQVKINPDNLSVLSTLPALRSANFFYSGPSGLRSVLEQLQLDRKIPEVDFRLIATDGENTIWLIIQGEEYGFPICRHHQQPIQELYPQLRYRELPNSINYVILNRRLRDFLREGDFGLTYPSRPPSDSNPPLSKALRRVADAGIARVPKVFNPLKLYILYHGLLEGDRVRLDELMKKCIHPSIILDNRWMDLYYEGEYVNLPVGNHIDAGQIDCQIHKLTNPDFMTLHEFDLVSDPPPDLRTIMQNFYNANHHYNQREPFYRSDGSYVEPE